MTAASPALTVADEVVRDCFTGDMSPSHALAELRSRGLTPDVHALAQALEALDERDRFLGEQGDPYSYLGINGPRISTESIWDQAVTKAETDYSSALAVLARRVVQAVAS